MDWYVPYLIPQENSNKTDIRQTGFRNSRGKRIRISGQYVFSFDALTVNSDYLSGALYPSQLKPFEGITVNLDYALSGVGCPSISVLNPFRTMPSVHHFRIVMERVNQ